MLSRLDKKIKITTLITVLSFLALPLFAQEKTTRSQLPEETKFSEMEIMAREYRTQGYDLQSSGDLDGAMSMYRKAIELDSRYPVAYNDLGIVYEEKGLIDEAEDCYLKAIQVDPGYASSYSNLGLLYEGKRDLDKAALYWSKRADLSTPGDPWREKAEMHMQDIRAVGSSEPGTIKEQSVLSLAHDVMDQKYYSQKDNKELSRVYFNKAKVHYRKGDEVTAYKEALNALQLDPSNEQIQEFMDRVRTRQLSK